MFRLPIRRLIALIFAWLAVAASTTLAAPFTPKERSQGYSDRQLIAKPRAGRVPQAEVEEARQDLRVRQSFPRLGGMRVLETGGRETADAAASRLRASGAYEYVEPDYLRRPHVLPNDSRLAAGEQWYLQNNGQNGGLAGADIRAAGAWDLRTDASAVIVAVIDSGVRLTHEDLAANLWTNPGEIPGNGLDDDGNGYVDDVHGINSLALRASPGSGQPVDDTGHGTAVAGIIGAVGNNAVGISGVAWRVRLMALKFDNAEGAASVSGAIECIDYAVAHGAHIINISYGSFGYSQAEYEAIGRAREAGVIVVTSAGNYGLPNDFFPTYPANYLLDNVVAVAASDARDALAEFSNWGSGLVELAAPGVGITTTGHETDSDYSAPDGTSFAAPLAAGTLALLRAQFSTDDYRGLINRMLGATDRLPAFGESVQTGGRLNAARALATTTNRPFNDDFANRSVLQGRSLVVRASNRHATAEAGELAHAGLPPGTTVWWTWTAPETGSAAIEITGSAFETVIAVYTGTTLAGLSPVPASGSVADTGPGRFAFEAVAGTAYQIAVGGKEGAHGAIVLGFGYLPPNDSFANAITLEGHSMRVAGFNTVASTEAGEPPAAAAGRNRTVWYKWIAPASNEYSFSVFPAGFTAVGTVFRGSSLGSLTRLVSTGPPPLNAAAIFDASLGSTYYFQIDSTDGNTGPFAATLLDGVALPGYYPANPSPAVNPASGRVYLVDTYGYMMSIGLEADLREVELRGTLEVHTPAIGADGAVYIGDEFGYLAAYEPDLTTRWIKDLGLTRVTSSPAIGADGAIYIHTDDGFLRGYFPDGSLKWSAAVPGESYSSPTIGADGTIYIGSDDEQLYALAPIDGSVRWKFKADGEIYASVAIDDSGSLYFGTLNGMFYSLTSGGTQRWVYRAGGAISSSAAIGAHIYFGSYDTYVHALNPATGELAWKYATGDEFRASSPAIASDGTVYIGSYDGFIHGITPQGLPHRTYATGAYIRSSPLIFDNLLFIGSGDTRVYLTNTFQGPASSAWPMHRQNLRRTGRRLLQTAPSIVTQPQARVIAAAGSARLGVHAEGADPLSFQWHLNGTPLPGATRSVLEVDSAAAGHTGLYSVLVSNTQGSTTTAPALVGVSTTAKLVGPGTEFPDIFHAGTGFTYDQLLLGGGAASLTADPGQITRLSYVDRNDDIVQIEFSGPGTVSISLDGGSGPANPAHYNQAVAYMKGHAGIVVTGASANSHLSVFSVGRANAANQALFRDEVTYDGHADLAYIAIQSADGKFGGLRTANAKYSATRGLTGVHAPGVEFTGPVFVGDIRAEGEATPVLVIGSGPDTRVTGGSLLQTNGRAVQVDGLAQLHFTPGSNSHGTLFPAQNNRGRLERNGADVTASLVVNPAP